MTEEQKDLLDKLSEQGNEEMGNGNYPEAMYFDFLRENILRNGRYRKCLAGVFNSMGEIRRPDFFRETKTICSVSESRQD